MDDDVIIRPMRESDVPTALEILKQWNMAPRPEEPDAERSRIDVARSFVAERDGKILGTASYIVLGPATAETASLAVDPESRGLGLGYRLQAARLDAMWAQGVRHVRTETDRPETVRWYTEKFGYVRTGTAAKKHDFSVSGIDHWVVLELDLADWISRQESR